MQDRLGKEQGGGDEAAFKDDKEEDDPESNVRPLFSQGEKPRRRATDDGEGEEVQPRRHQHHVERDAQGARRLEALPMVKQRGSQHRRRVQRSALDGVQDQEPEGNRRGAEDTGDDPFLIEPRDVRRRCVESRRSQYFGLVGHDTLLSGRRPFEG
jgi:hypothetical protein